MLYRELGKTGEKVSILGLGTMRLPVIDGDNEKIDVEKAEEILKYGIDNGINYVDTAYPYHGNSLDKGGMSEIVVGNFLEKGYRDKVLLATKLPTWLVSKKEDFEYYLNEQLKRLKTDYFDIYLVHDVNKTVWPMLVDLGLFEYLDKIKEDGKVKYIGFSFHDDLDLFLEVMDSYDWDVVQTQMNYLDTAYESGLTGLQYVSSLNIGNIVMEPLRGGSLVNNISPDIEDLWNSSEVKRSPAEWAFRYLYDMEEVDIVLSGMTTLEQLKENLDIAERGTVNSLSKKDHKLIEEVTLALKSKKMNGCTECGYCMPCPEGVDIPTCLKEYNRAMMFVDANAVDVSRYYYDVDENSNASKCNECKTCIPLCTQQLNIPEELKKVKKVFGR
ncbi:MAG: aldo/keto reductase [Methanobrevibacter sp.]|jgi:predicted aldo/keto reductase-like oxidoreductase|nr:aldo/keto reductase [Candidatus Methanoflexus mossambicus]